MHGLHIDYIIGAVGHTQEMWEAYLFQGIYQWCEMYISVFQVILLNALVLHVAHMLTVISCAHELIGTCGLICGIGRTYQYLSHTWHCCLSHDVDGAMNDTIAFVILRWLSSGIMTLCAGASINCGISVMCHWWCYLYYVMLMPVVSPHQKILVSPHFSCHDLRNTVVPLTTPLALVVPIPVVPHDPESHGAPHFICLDLRNAVYHWWCCQQQVTLMPAPVVSHDQRIFLYQIWIALT